MATEHLKRFTSHYRSRLRSVLVLSTVVLLLGLALYRGVVHGQEKENGPKPASSAKQSVPVGKPNAAKTEGGEPAGPKEGVSLTGHLSRDSARPDGKIRFWVTIENNTDAVIRNLRFADFFTPGFDRPPQFSGGCAGATWGQICAELPSKATVTVWGDLAASEKGSTKENAFLRSLQVSCDCRRRDDAEGDPKFKSNLTLDYARPHRGGFGNMLWSEVHSPVSKPNYSKDAQNLSSKIAVGHGINLY
jgi:hypothetical protein